MTGASGVGLVARLRARARALKRETHVLYLACRDPRTPWYAKALAGGVVAYALSPIDLIPDFIPVIGYLDDLIIVPLGISTALRMIRATVLDDCRVRADEAWDRPTSRRVAALIVGMLARVDGACALARLRPAELSAAARRAGTRSAKSR